MNNFIDALKRIATVDLRCLAVFRICLGLLLLFDLCNRYETFPVFYPGLDREILLSVQIFCAGMLLFGVYPRVMALVSWLLLMGLNRSYPHAQMGGDAYMEVMLFWGMFAPLGEYFSIMGRKTEATVAASPATAAILIQTCFIYLSSGIAKWNGGDWTSGQALWHVMHNAVCMRPSATCLLGLPSLLKVSTRAILAFEIIGPFVLLFRGRIGNAAAIGFIALQTGIFCFMDLTPFPQISILSVIPFFAFKHPRIYLKESRDLYGLVTILMTGLILCAFRFPCQNIPNIYRQLGLSYSWPMFASTKGDMMYFVSRGRLRNGREIDLFHLDGRPFTWAHLSPSDQFYNHRLIYAVSHVEWNSNRVVGFWSQLGYRLRTVWQAHHSRNEDLVSIEFFRLTTPIPNESGIVRPYQRTCIFKRLFR